MMLGPTEVVILAVVAICAVVVWGMVDAAKRPDYAWSAAEQNKVLWVALQAIGLVLGGPLGVAVTIAYLIAIRPKVHAGEVLEP